MTAKPGKLIFKELSPRAFKWLMALYPPLLLNRIYPVFVSKDFTKAVVKIKKSFLNKNPNKTIFGGTLACAADPWIGAMYWQILTRRKIKARIWVRAIELDFIKPADTDITMDIKIPQQDIEEAVKNLTAKERYVKQYVLEMKTANGETCCIAKQVMVMYPVE